MRFHLGAEPRRAGARRRRSLLLRVLLLSPRPARPEDYISQATGRSSTRSAATDAAARIYPIGAERRKDTGTRTHRTGGRERPPTPPPTAAPEEEEDPPHTPVGGDVGGAAEEEEDDDDDAGPRGRGRDGGRGRGTSPGRGGDDRRPRISGSSRRTAAHPEPGPSPRRAARVRVARWAGGERRRGRRRRRRCRCRRGGPGVRGGRRRACRGRRRLAAAAGPAGLDGGRGRSHDPVAPPGARRRGRRSSPLAFSAADPLHARRLWRGERRRRR
uniref:Uncharacterized protein n=1 Tax=Human herpesvirus 2 TaxID=10310 RepID=A0A481TNL9_HHV2|nr:hypothetical protein [Human alphaherpesvirus 2]